MSVQRGLEASAVSGPDYRAQHENFEVGPDQAGSTPEPGFVSPSHGELVGHTDSAALLPSSPADSDTGSDVVSIPEKLQFDHFGDLVRYLRLSYAERLGKNVPGGPSIELKQLAMIRCMHDRGYDITSGTISLIEQGKTLPRDPIGFVRALCACLALGPHDFYFYLLPQQFNFDVVARTSGRAWAEALIPVGADLADRITRGSVDLEKVQQAILGGSRAK